ncbi:MAG: hypothetical protein N2442_12790 [Spirochaetes bacterium]|nr:hypothetical protein [Spirochaetota bacterium]
MGTYPTRALSVLVLVLGVLGFGTFSSPHLPAETITIVAPYMGWVTNTYENDSYKLNLEDSGFLSGMYLQSINPSLFQWNAFLYYSPDVNYSTLWGGHFIVDFYPIGDFLGKYLVGAGVEVIRIDMDAGNSIKVPAGPPPATTTLEGFNLTNTIIIPYARVGKYLVFGMGPVQFSVLPWIGATYESVQGTIKFTAQFSPPPAPKTSIDTSFDDSAWYATAGINLKLTLFRFLDIEGKYQATFDGEVYHPSFSLIANLFFTRNWGLSYRYKYMETSGGKDSYNLFGVAYVF